MTQQANEDLVKFRERYEAVDAGQIIGKGGYGSISSYYDLRNNRRVVAVKSVAPDPRQRQRRNYIQREIDILRTVQHPNLMGLIDHNLYAFTMDGQARYLFVLEKMEQELWEYLHDPDHRFPRPLSNQPVRPEKLTLDTVKHIVLQIGLGLQFLHSKNIVHRDLKLENVMVNSHGGTLTGSQLEVKIIDFGLSRVLDTGDMSTQLGSKRYMPPEIRNPHDTYSTRADMWSFGTIIFILLARKYPFRDDRRTKWPKIDEGVQFSGVDEFDDRTNEGRQNKDVINRLLCPQIDRMTITEFLIHDFMEGYYVPPESYVSNVGLDGVDLTQETLMYIRPPNSRRPFRIILSTMDFTDLDDPNAAVLVSILTRNLPLFQEKQGQSTTTFPQEMEIEVGQDISLKQSKSSIGQGIIPPPFNSSSGSMNNGSLSLEKNASWNYQSSSLKSNGKLGSLGKVLTQLKFEDGQQIPLTNYDNVLVKFHLDNSPCFNEEENDEGQFPSSLEASATNNDPLIPCRDLFSILLDTEIQPEKKKEKIPNTTERAWHIYSSLRQRTSEIVSDDDTNLYMSLIGYSKRDENGEELNESDKVKLCQQVSQEIAGFAAHLTKTVDPAKLNSMTILVFGDLFQKIKDSFRALGTSGAMNVIHDSQYLNHLSGRIRRNYNISSLSSPLLTYIHCTIETMEDSTYDSLAHCLQICYWGGRVADVVKEMKQKYEEEIAQSSALSRDTSTYEEEKDRENNTPVDRFAFILDEDHAVEILERNAFKAEKNSPYLNLLEVFDASITLIALEYLLKMAPYLKDEVSSNSL